MGTVLKRIEVHHFKIDTVEKDKDSTVQMYVDKRLCIFYSILKINRRIHADQH